MQRHVVIIGGGLSGTLTLLKLLGQADAAVRVTLVERDLRRVGRGVAYQREYQSQLLNVRAGHMSLYPERPDHFVRFVAASDFRQPDTVPLEQCFVPRALFGDYLAHELRTTVAAYAERAALVTGEAVAVTPVANRFVVTLRDGESLRADAVVFAPGNSPPGHACTLSAATLDDPAYIDNPWQQGIFDTLEHNRDIVVLGAGLTAVDHIVSLHQRGHRGTIHVVSRRGWWPAEHRVPGAASWHEPALFAAAAHPRTLFRHLRQVIAAHDAAPWTDLVDALRPYVNRIWQGWSRDAKRMFLRHLRPLWEIHRHRVPAELRAILRRMERSGQLRVHAGRILEVAREEGRFAVRLSPRAGGSPVTIAGDMVVNCIGPEMHWRKVAQPLVETLMAHNLVSIDPLAMGLRADSAGRSVVDGEYALKNFFLIGPVRKGELWETTALREIREQASAIVDALTDARRHAA